MLRWKAEWLSLIHIYMCIRYSVGAVKTEQGVEVKGMLMQPVVEKCEGCDRVRTFEEQQFCGSYPNPAKKWFDGRCNFATHIKTESGKAAKVNPLKASKRAAKGR